MYKKNHSPHERPLVAEDEHGAKKRNPNQITVNQHVIPQAHLEEWARPDGLLNVFNKQQQSWLSPAVGDAFTVRRLWDQATEQTFLRVNEHNYQRQADLVKASQPIESHEHISAYFFMLCIRADIATRPRPGSNFLVEPSSRLPSQTELEEIELQNAQSSVHVSYPGDDGSQAISRDVVKLAMITMFRRGMGRFKGFVWVPVVMTDQDAILPDSLIQINAAAPKILPVTPRIVLLGSLPGSEPSPDAALDSSAINARLLYSSVTHYVALTRSLNQKKEES